MLDIAVIRRDPDRVRNTLIRRGLDPSPVGEILRYDEEYRSALSDVEQAKAEKNRLSLAIGEAEDKAATARELRPKLSELAQRLEGLEERARSLSVSGEASPLRALLDNMPNLSMGPFLKEPAKLPTSSCAAGVSHARSISRRSRIGS